MAATGTPPSEAELKEAEQYWGYLISTDRTGTDKFKNLLRGLHNLISSTFDPYDSSDLKPSQLARFYRSCNGNYDQLFLSTPPSTVAFIYKNLGCSHSLQPLPISPTDPKYSDPVIPALKVEGWIVWSTIQLLLAPEEHASFLRQAVARWDIRVPGTSNDFFPKLLPRSCFPPAPDPIMQTWYDGMTERLRREMEEEESIRIKAVEERPDSPMHKHHRIHERRYSYETDESDSPDTRDSALAYFRNPLFRTVDGRPGVVRRGSKRPPLSPRHSFVARGKTAAATVGRVVQNVASPHLWDGHLGNKQAQHKDAEKRRKSLPDKHRHQDDDHVAPSQNSPTGLHPRYNEKHVRRGSHAAESPPYDHDHAYWRGGVVEEDGPRRSHSQLAHSPDIHHRPKSHEPRSSSREYFPPPTHDGEGSGRRNSATFLDPRSSTNNKSPNQAGFKPSVSPLFATHVARGENPNYPYDHRSQPRPTLQRRTDYKSPERAGSRPGSGREEWEGSDTGSIGRSSSQRKPPSSQQGSKPSSRYPTPVGGVDGRRYPISGDIPYRRV